MHLLSGSESRKAKKKAAAPATGAAAIQDLLQYPLAEQRIGTDCQPVVVPYRENKRTTTRKGRFSDLRSTEPAPSHLSKTVGQMPAGFAGKATNAHSGATVTDFHRVPVWVFCRYAAKPLRGSELLKNNADYIKLPHGSNKKILLADKTAGLYQNWRKR